MKKSVFILIFSCIKVFTIVSQITTTSLKDYKYADEPTAQPTNLTFSNIKSYTFNVSFTPASPPAESYIVLRKTNSPITDVPVDGVTYQKGDYIGTAQVAYVGNGNSFTPSNITANTTYYFNVFAFNGQNGDENYLQTNPLSNSATTIGAMIGNYYNGISSTSPSFIDDLHNLINPHTQLAYSDYDDYLINHFESRDTTDGQGAVTCVYTSYNYVYSEPFAWDTLSREHTFCHSWMPTNPATALPEYSDYHNLFPVHFQRANLIRSNYPLGIVEQVTYEFLDGKFGKDEEQQWVYEPRDTHKGDAARAMFYMVLCYNSVNGNTWALPSSQNQQVLKQWHFQDPPDNWEIARNDYIYSIQNNRNPFIDSIHFVNFINFYNLGIIEQQSESDEILIYPNPATMEITIEIENGKWKNLSRPGGMENVKLKIYDLLGNEVIVQSSKFKVQCLEQGTGNIEQGTFVIDVSGLPNGVYIVKLVVSGAEPISHEKNVVVKKLVKM